MGRLIGGHGRNGIESCGLLEIASWALVLRLGAVGRIKNSGCLRVTAFQ